MNDHRAFYRCLVFFIATILAGGLGAATSVAQTYVCPPGYYFLAGYGCYPYGGYRTVPPGYYYYPPPYPYAVTAPPPVVYPAPSFGFGFEFGGHDHDHDHDGHGHHR